jgi:hypothetical protein
MSPLELSKHQIVDQLRRLCAHCANGDLQGQAHNCPVQGIAARIEAIRGVPLMVNNEFKGVLWR